MKSKLHRYPPAYSQLLLALPSNGDAFELTLSSPDAAQRERLAFYNFLKFLRRNPAEAAHFSGREDLVMISLRGNVLRFQLRTTVGATELEEAFRSQLGDLTKMPANLRRATDAPAPAPYLPPTDEAPDLTDDAPPTENPMDIFLNHTKKGKNS